jgi:FtsZ-binding cell division protein ZapB
MTDDILTRLRSYAYLDDAFYNPWVYGEAADEIERLREEIQQLKHDSTIFINERSDAICENFDLREENAELREENAELRETAIAALKEGEKKDG